MLSSSLLKKLQRWLRTIRTVRHLKPRQAWYFFLRRGIGARSVSPSSNGVNCRDVTINSALTLAHMGGDFFNYEFNFLNNTLNFSRNAMDWNPQNAQRLWRYNLHYFDFLREQERPLQQKIALIEDWIINNPQGSEPAWEPYTASLRIVNWCLFFWSLPRKDISEKWLQSLHTQARWLDRNLELHILANHYFENIKAMIFAAIFFDDSYSVQWLNRYQKKLIQQLNEQTLKDGGHYERSPQYHCVLLEGYLDIYALLQNSTASVKPETLTTLRQTITSGLRFLALIVTPDDDIPLFNDSASGTASKPSALFGKAEQLGFHIEWTHTALIDLPISGLFGWKADNDYFLIDCGNIGPSYQPGHTHCDFLSFVLMIDGKWLIVDSGVCEYEPGSMRTYVRSTSAHNTVTIDDYEQSEIWGEFRVGHRAHSLGASINRENNKIIFEGAFSGFAGLQGGAVHQRRVELILDQQGAIQTLAVNDQIDGRPKQQHILRTLLHLHPEVKTDITTQIALLSRDGVTEAIINGSDRFDASTEPSWFCPEFGLKHPNPLLQMRRQSSLPAHFSYKITPKRHTNKSSKQLPEMIS